MKFMVVYASEPLRREIHAEHCKEVDVGDGRIVGFIEAANPFGAAIEETGGDERNAIEHTLYFPCLSPRATTTRRRRKRTDDLTRLDDVDIIDAVMGRRIVWVNGQTGREEDARLFPPGPHDKRVGGAGPTGRLVTTFPHNYTKITVASDGSRQLSFLDAGGTGFRAARIESIVSVR